MKCIKKSLIIFIVLGVTLLCSCDSRVPDKKSLSDLGGVYSSNFENMDFDVEVSGRLTEDTASDIEYSNDMESVNAFNEQYDNRVYSWGLSRSPGGQLPKADPGAPELLSKYGGFYLGDTSSKVIYLTFDEGYENGYTSKILDVLKEKNVKATFFITGPYLKEHEDLVARMVNEGHTVGNHTINHPSLPQLEDKVLEEEVLGLSRAFKEKFGKDMKFLRPPKGEYSERSLALTQKLGYRNVFWSFAYDDWYRDKVRGPEYAYNMVMRNLHNGAILLLHAVSKDNADALGAIIDGVRAKGYVIGDINDIK